MSDAAERVQRDIALSSEAEEIAETAARELQKRMHTSLPGIVRSFDPKTQTAVVQPALQQVRVDEGPVNIPQCMDVPVYFPGGGGFVHTFPVAPGDGCLLVFSERAIDFWHEHGGVQLPAEYRLHDLSDAFAFVGFRPKPEAVAGFFAGGSELRTLDGQTVIRLENGMVTAGNVAGAAFATRADVMQIILSMLKAHTHVLVGTSPPGGGPITGAATPSPDLASMPDPSARNVKIS